MYVVLLHQHSRFEIGAMQGQWRVCGWAGNWYIESMEWEYALESAGESIPQKALTQ